MEINLISYYKKKENEPDQWMKNSLVLSNFLFENEKKHFFCCWYKFVSWTIH